MNTVTTSILEISQADWFQPALLVAMVAVAATAVRRFWRKARRSATSLVAVFALLGVSPTMMTAWVTEAVSSADYSGVAEIIPASNSPFALPTEWTTVTNAGEEFLCTPNLRADGVVGFVCDHQVFDSVSEVEPTKGGLFETFTVTASAEEHYACEELSNESWKCPTDRRVFNHKEVTS